MGSIKLLGYLLSFAVFIVLQSVFINGTYDTFKGKEIPNDLIKGKTWDGNILYPVRRFLSNYIKEWWQRPLFKCVKCMSSIYGIITFLPMVIYLFGFRWIEIPIQIFDIGALVYVNEFFYKKV